MRLFQLKSMRLLTIIGFLSLSATALKGQSQEKSLNFNLKLQNLFFWRGLVPSHTPMVQAELFYNLKGDRLKLGCWGGFSFDGRYRVISYNLRYDYSGLYIEVWDNPSASDFLDVHTTHLVDVTLAYTLQKRKFPLKISWSTMVLGRDTYVDASGGKK